MLVTKVKIMKLDEKVVFTKYGTSLIEAFDDATGVYHFVEQKLDKPQTTQVNLIQLRVGRRFYATSQLCDVREADPCRHSRYYSANGRHASHR